MGSKKPWWYLQPRFVVVLATFLATAAAYVERVGFSIAFTAMAKDANVDESVKGTVLSSFYWGYALSQVGSTVGPPGACGGQTTALHPFIL